MEIQNIQDLLRELEEDNISGASEFIDKALEIVKFQLRLTSDPHKDIREEIIYLSKEIIGYVEWAGSGLFRPYNARIKSCL